MTDTAATSGKRPSFARRPKALRGRADVATALLCFAGGFREEQAKIFAGTEFMGRQSQLARPGFFVQQVAGESLVMVRDQKGAVWIS